MTYEEIVARAKELYARRAGKKSLRIAVEFDITGPGEGAFYALLKDGAFDVEPYEYYDRDVLVQAPADVVLAVASGETSLASLVDRHCAFGNRATAAAFDGAGVPARPTRRVNPKKAKKKEPEEELKEAVKTAEEKAAKAASHIRKAAGRAKTAVKKTAEKAEEKKPELDRVLEKAQKDLQTVVSRAEKAAEEKKPAKRGGRKKTAAPKPDEAKADEKNPDAKDGKALRL
jgi:hypothetical protein